MSSVYKLEAMLSNFHQNVSVLLGSEGRQKPQHENWFPCGGIS